MRIKRDSEFGNNRPAKGGSGLALGAMVIACALLLLSAGAFAAEKSDAKAESSATPVSLEETRLTMDKWIETQQIISKERKDWQQGKEILQGRLEMVKKEVETLKEKVKQAGSSVAETEKKRKEFLAEDNLLKEAGKQLTDAITVMEGDIRNVYKQLPDPVQTKLQPLYQRVPEEPSKTRVSAAERFQNVLGILNELNKANNELAVSYEVHKLADGKPSEVRAVYIGLAQAYYISARGEGGIGRPTADGWKWEASDTAVARDILGALEIIQGKQTPAFVPLPVKIQ